MSGPQRLRLDVSYGGQAVLEGVMMRGPQKYAVAVRRPDQEVVIHQEPLLPMTRRYRFVGIPFVRGAFVLYESLHLGISALMFSAQQTGEEGEEMTRGEMNLTLLLSLSLSILLFVLAPTWLIGWLETRIQNGTALNLLEGALRIGMLVAYIGAIAMMDEIRRVLEYHGAEHKVINNYESGLELSVENARRQSRFHPRCGTSFLLIVALISILLFGFFGWPGFWERILIRLALLPVVAGVAYEVIRFSGRTDSPIVAFLVKPGMWLQGLTTREPDDDQLEVALRALQATMEDSPQAV